MSVAEELVGEGAASGAAGGVIELDDVRFSYPDGTEVLDGISASIKAGTTVAIVGPSGCGKSTLLYLIAKLLEPTGGVIERHLKPAAVQHPLSMVFQKDTVLPWLTVADNVRLYGRFKRHKQRRGRIASILRRIGLARGPHPADELDDRVPALLRMVHLTDFAKRYPYQLSGGMRRRLAFLTGVAPQPQILLLDEPFSSVDEPTRIGIHQDVFKAIRSLKMTTILVTHDLAEAITLSDRVLILSNRPSSIAHIHDIPFGDDRDMLHLRATPEYLQVYAQLWDDLAAQIAARNATHQLD
jgi:ABC-type nitrate/sulfonate/bicarbonate transport system ATPase subunit